MLFTVPPLKEFVVQSASACSVMFKVHQASCIVAVESFFKKSLQKEIRWRKVWWSWWPKAVPDNAVTEEVLQESCCCFHSMAIHPILLKPAFPFIFFQQYNGLSRQILIIFRNNCLFKKQWSYNSLLTHCAPNISLWQMQRISMQCMWVFRTAYATVGSVHCGRGWGASYMLLAVFFYMSDLWGALLLITSVWIEQLW